MGQAAIKLEPMSREGAPAPVVTFKPATAGMRPKLVGSAPKSDLPALLGMVTRVATLLSSQRDRADLWEKRHGATEEQLKIANAKIVDLDVRLKTALDEAKAERTRAAEIHRRSAEVVEKTRAMLTDASTRLKSAEARADRAEDSFSSFRDAFERQIGSQLR